MDECWERGNINIKSFGWSANGEAKEVGIDEYEISRIVTLSGIPSWMFPKPIVDFQIQTELKEDKNNQKNIIVQRYLDKYFSSWLQIFTDGSKDPVSGRAAGAVYIPKFQCNIKKRITDYVAVYTAQLIAILLALQWVEDVKRLPFFVFSKNWPWPPKGCKSQFFVI